MQSRSCWSFSPISWKIRNLCSSCVAETLGMHWSEELVIEDRCHLWFTYGCVVPLAPQKLLFRGLWGGRAVCCWIMWVVLNLQRAVFQKFFFALPTLKGKTQPRSSNALNAGLASRLNRKAHITYRVVKEYSWPYVLALSVYSGMCG